MRQTPKGPLLEIVAVVGPTASGKTELAVDLARALGGEVISADSRQVYRELDAGTAKPGVDSRGLVEGIPYHLLDVADPAESFDAGRYARLAGAVMEDIRRRGCLAIVAGGTGLYVRALLEGLSEMPPSDAKVRERLLIQARNGGGGWLHSRLRAVDPAAAAKIPANNVQRTLRALEVHEVTGKPISSFWRRDKAAAKPAAFLFIDWPAEELKTRIALRARTMWPKILEETRGLLKNGLSGLEPGFQSLGYREAVACLRDELPCAAGLARLIQSTNQYAKRQLTWFRNQTPGAAMIAGGSRQDMLSDALKALGKRDAAAIAR